LRGRLLDAGCGTGEHTLLAAAHGAEAVGVDISAPAIENARRKAAERGIPAGFELADALALDKLDLTSDTTIDSGLFHAFDDALRTAYVTSLRSVLGPGGYFHLMCFSDRQPGDWGPRRIRKDEIIAADAFELNPGLDRPTASV
jgi:cyclopropane fatty-acyl-phospholipid synthase-like methyltransferase